MENILAQAQSLVYSLLLLMPSRYQQENLETMLGLFLEAQGHPLPQHSQTKSASALSRFLNLNCWPTRKLIRTIRQQILKQILAESPRGIWPFIQVIIELTTLGKRGKFQPFENLIKVYNGKRGLHLVVLYLVVGRWRRGKNHPSPAQLGLKLVKRLPKALTQRFRVMILVDTAGSVEFLRGVRRLKFHVIAGVSCDRQLVDGRRLRQLCNRGQQVYLVGLKFPVSVSWYYLKRDNGLLEKRFVLSTKQLKASTITRWVRRRWQMV
ncbi:IS701 family transposase [Microseira wollei]|uniref:Transposase n=1 Tax=Microseira wollei NIES-4236 TaxID=2530354 RepID=A0AAV3XQZ3_9CYAN|nr:IS701 family transposase [Microseira wollei]GET44158.1 hypothetical protein MiSe_89840 [Microseira wollei NIES-4236]